MNTYRGALAQLVEALDVAISRIPKVCFIVVFLFSPCTLWGQSTDASIGRRVTDPSKAIVADAKVATIKVGTNFRYQAATNESGEYAAPNLPPGAYRLEVAKEGPISSRQRSLNPLGL